MPPPSPLSALFILPNNPSIDVRLPRYLTGQARLIPFMVDSPPSKGRRDPATAAEPSLSRHSTSLQELGLDDQELTENYVPPPAYGEYYGEIHDERNGTGTSAQITDDGRIAIRINHFSRQLSQILAPALHQHVQDVEDSRELPPVYVPPSLGGDPCVPPPPSLNIVIQVVGSRGDVQPFVALGKVLKNVYRHRVRLATHSTFKEFVEQHGLEFFSIGGDPTRLMAFMVKNPGLRPGFRSMMSGDVSQQRKHVAEYIQGCWRSCYRADDGTEDGSSEPAGSDDAGSRPFRTPLANIQSSNADPQLTNYISYAMVELLSWQGLGDIINRFRVKCLALDPISTIWAPGMLQRLRIPHTYCWSPALIPKPTDWGAHISVSGFYFLEMASAYTPARDLQAFLDAGPNPVYIGFGSIVLDDPDTLTELIFTAVRKTGQRVLLSKGWGGMGADELRIPEGVFMLDNVPHDWLFAQVACVVHHGGAGTTAAGIAAGCPTVVVPFFGDQPFWGAMIARAGAGPRPIPHRQLTADNLAEAIEFCLTPRCRERAAALARTIAAERGTAAGAQSFHQFLDPSRLRCTVAPSRAAAWRLRRTQLADLKLFRAQEYATDGGPWDPISGGFTAFVRAFNGMTMGLADIPAETWRGLRMPAAGRSSRRQSLAAGDAPRDMLQPTGVHVSNGAGRFVKAMVQGPVDMSVNFARGFHNMPRLWGDETVRPQERVSDFKSGVKAVGREFGYGWYDGVTGLVTQPWRGAQKGGAGGFVKGIGKGFGGFIAKPSAALFGILGHTMQGVSKEVQKLFGSDVQSYIIASRVAQGYEEWLQASEAERQDVITRWKLMQKDLKKRQDPMEGVRRAQTAQQRANADSSAEAWTHHRSSTMPDVDQSESTLQTSEPWSEAPWEEAAGVPPSTDTAEDYDTEFVSGVEPQQHIPPPNGDVRDEKTSQEKSREEVVLAYVKEQSLLEIQYKNKGKVSATATEVEDDEDLRKALTLSMQEYEHRYR
ncbi:UDP-Glycosyltransferase/glycogen phosphorylase [Penicillium chermesinum]|uniref:UDP-Glycosyltransferase/glycogen phosphorylase n=1 Tax=Penicillium chermesinum TaxID=63820 RepID=A0A9W9P0M4_9EURO|nr:UDP-Glycosyltransferase/glycogen phosphorylase [Penicillium chermesinum]KAJ5233189.1 UDP-Glycosyltransferase/glycogen phosphorylase [Penicillium chermesinum]